MAKFLPPEFPGGPVGAPPVPEVHEQVPVAPADAGLDVPGVRRLVDSVEAVRPPVVDQRPALVSFYRV